MLTTKSSSYIEGVNMWFDVEVLCRVLIRAKVRAGVRVRVCAGVRVCAEIRAGVCAGLRLCVEALMLFLLLNGSTCAGVAKNEVWNSWQVRYRLEVHCCLATSCNY